MIPKIETMKKGPNSLSRGREKEKKVHGAGERSVARARQRLIEVVEDPAVTEMRAHVLGQLGTDSIEAAMRDENNVSMLCSGAFSPEDVGSTVFAEMLMAAARSSKTNARLILDSLSDLRSLAEGDKDDKEAVERAAQAARERLR